MTMEIGPEPERDNGVPVDVYREGDRYFLAADLPGLDPGSLEIDVRGQLLTIRGHRTLRGLDGTHWLERDRSRGLIERQVLLGGRIKTEEIDARFECGVLSLCLPADPDRPARKIDVDFR